MLSLNGPTPAPRPLKTMGKMLMTVDELLERYDYEGDPDLPCQCMACGHAMPDSPDPCPKCGCHAREVVNQPGIHPAKVTEEVKAMRVAGLEME